MVAAVSPALSDGIGGGWVFFLLWEVGKGVLYPGVSPGTRFQRALQAHQWLPKSVIFHLF